MLAGFPSLTAYLFPSSSSSIAYTRALPPSNARSVGGSVAAPGRRTLAMVRSATPLHVKLAKAAAYGGVWYAGAYVEMGVPTFIALVIYAMFTCGTGTKWAGDASAYSIFNDGENIAGSMTAAQIDAQMRNGGHAPQKAAVYESSFVQSATRGWGGGSEHQPAVARAGRPASGEDEELRRRREAAAAAAQARAKASSGRADVE